MLDLVDRPLRLCDGLGRRAWLRVGGLNLGLGLGELLGARRANASAPEAHGAAEGRSFGRARGCIQLFLLGGPPQHDTWDPKPDAPVEIRGPLGSIDSATPGLRVGELMPRTARLTERIAVLRSLATADNAHSSSGYWMLTGRPHTPRQSENARPGFPNDAPALAAIVQQLSQRAGPLPAAFRLPEEIWNTGRIVWPGQDAGFLGPGAEPWLLACEPQQPTFEVPGVSLPRDLPPLVFDGRRRLLDQLNAHFARAERAGGLERWTHLERQALDLIGTGRGAGAFRLDEEPAAVRDRYGRNRFGQSVLLARRLIEAGVALVQVNWTRMPGDTQDSPAWDTHRGNDERLRSHLMPIMDQAYSALLEDLDERGLLNETLVVWCGEFGRTPKINPRGGRDHWGHVFSAALAGGGIRGGQVVGCSDADGAYPLDDRHEPQDLVATILHLLGIEPETMLRDRQGRPIPASTGTPIAAMV